MPHTIAQNLSHNNKTRPYSEADPTHPHMQHSSEAPTMAIHDLEDEEEEVLFPPSHYYVQSPSTTISISNTPTFEFPRCSSTRDSLMSNAHDSKLTIASYNTGTVVSSRDEDDRKNFIHGYEKDEYDEVRSSGFRKYLSFGTYDGSIWLAIQLGWRFLVSLAAALLVFYLVTKPPPPQISVKVGGIREFELAEGVDGSGVATKIMWCNASIEIVIDNHSKVFGLHLLPSRLQMSFQHLDFAVSQGGKVVAERDHVTSLEVFLGTKSKPMYGAGRMMQDKLDSGLGLPLAVDVTIVSNYRVVGELIRPWYHHHARCLILIKKGYDSKNRTHRFTNTCNMFAYH